MAEITLVERTSGAASQALEQGELLHQLCGGWSATCTLADPGQRNWSGLKVRLLWLGKEHIGTVESQAVTDGKTTVFVVGGDGALLRDVPSKHYQNATPKLIAQELCAAAKERLSNERLPPTSLFQFPRRRAALCDVLDDLARAAGCIWGVLPSGEIWLGRPPWTPAPPFDSDELDGDDVFQTTLFQVREFGPLPGQTFGGRRVGCARYTLSPDHDTRLRLWFQVGEATLDDDPLRAGFAALVRQTVPTIWLGKYPGIVRAVRGNGTWDIQLDDLRMPPLVGVRPRVFAPGARVVPPIKTRVEVSFEQYDPRYPVAELFEPANGGKALVIDGDQVDAGKLVLTVTGGGGAPAVLSGTYTDPFGASTVVTSGTSIQLKGKIKSSQTRAYL